MKTIRVSVATVIEAPATGLYHILADYCHAHPAILPKPYFERLKVEHGGQGAGTVFWLWMNVFGRKHAFHEIVTEPVPGRVLVETDLATGQRSVFTLEPMPDAGWTRVTIVTDFQARPGLVGLLEQYLNLSISRLIFRKELQLLGEYAAAKAVWDREAQVQVPG